MEKDLEYLKGFSVAVTRDYGDYGLCTIVRLELRFDRGCGGREGQASP
jgi:hypothetical protein